MVSEEQCARSESSGGEELSDGETVKAAGKCALDPGANRKPQQAAEQKGEARQKCCLAGLIGHRI